MDTDGWQPIDARRRPLKPGFCWAASKASSSTHLRAAVRQANRVRMALHSCAHALEAGAIAPVWPIARLVPPEILEPRRRQLGIADGVLDCSMAEPILNGPRVVSGVRQCVAAAMAQRVRVHREIEASTLPNAFNQAIDSVGRERAAALGCEYKAAVRELPAKFA